MTEILLTAKMVRLFTIIIWVLCMVFLGTGAAIAQDLNVNAYVNTTTIGINQQFELTVELSGSDANGAPQPSLPDIDTFASFVGTSSSTSMQFINGKSSVTRSFTHHYIATQEGKFRIPAISVAYKGKVYSSKPIDVSIVRNQSPAQPKQQPKAGSPSAAEDFGELLFLKASVAKKRVYQNEPVVVSYKIYTALNVTNYGISQLPNTVGFWSEDFELPGRPRLHNEVLNGRQYRVAEIKRMALFPQGPGKKKIEPLVIECEVQAPRQQRRRRDIFDSFFDDPFFGLNRTVRKVINSNVVNIDVLPVPAKGKPGDFSGAVGTFSLKASIDKKHVKTNEAVALKIVISGTGNVKIIPQPTVSFPPDFEVYDPEVTENISRKGNQISGSKTFEFVLIPRFPGRQTIKPVRFSYFDPAAQSYRTLASEAFDIIVDKGDEQFVGAGFGSTKEDVKFIGQDIRFIQTRLPEFHKRGSVFYKSWVFYATLVFPLLAMVGSVFYRRYLDKLSSNVAYARSRKANQMAQKRLKKARAELKKGDRERFYAEVANAMMGFIGDKFNVAAAGLITEHVAEMLRQRGIDDQTVLMFLGCLQTCDYRRFAPGESNNGEMTDFLEEATKAIVSLDREV